MSLQPCRLVTVPLLLPFSLNIFQCSTFKVLLQADLLRPAEAWGKQNCFDAILEAAVRGKIPQDPGSQLKRAEVCLIQCMVPVKMWQFFPLSLFSLFFFITLHLFLYCPQSSVSAGAQISAEGQCANASALPVHHLVDRRLAALQRPFSHDDICVPKGRSRKGIWTSRSHWNPIASLSLGPPYKLGIAGNL